MADCIFCDIVAGKSPAKYVSTNAASAVAFHPINPVTEGHILVVPSRHVEDFTTDPSVSAGVMRVASALAADMGPVNLITSKGREATQSVFHLHVHLVPRRKDDGLALPWTNQQSHEAPPFNPDLSITVEKRGHSVYNDRPWMGPNG